MPIWLAGSPAAASVGKMHTAESIAGPALLRLPVGPAVARCQDRAVIPDRPAGVRVGKIHAFEMLFGPAVLLLPAGPAVARCQDCPPVSDHPTRCARRQNTHP